MIEPVGTLVVLLCLRPAAAREGVPSGGRPCWPGCCWACPFGLKIWAVATGRGHRAVAAGRRRVAAATARLVAACLAGRRRSGCRSC
jgi:hypothetical protein